MIRAGGLVGMPTETVYGLAADALNEDAIRRIFVAKGRPLTDPLIVHVGDAEHAWTVAVPTASARRLAERFWPGPLTLVLQRRDVVPALVSAGLATVAVRCPAHPIALALVRASGRPLAAPSANLFGRISPTTAAHVREQLGDRVDIVLDGGPCAVGIESTVLRPDPTPVILRPGGVTREAIATALDVPVTLGDRAQRAASVAMESPGMLASHYAPRLPMILRERGAPWPDDASLGYLALRGDDLPPAARHVEILSPTGDLDEAAANLFAALRRLDDSPVRVIVAETVREAGLGVGINDRLRRAAGLG